MRRFVWLALACLLALPIGSASAKTEFNAADYQTSTQSDLVKNPDAHVGKKYRVTEPFQFCGSDFCFQQRMKINTRDYYCFTLGPLCLVRMYIKRDHPQAQTVLDLKKGDKVTVYGTFDRMGSNYNYLIVDQVTIERK